MMGLPLDLGFTSQDLFGQVLEERGRIFSIFSKVRIVGSWCFQYKRLDYSTNSWYAKATFLTNGFFNKLRFLGQ